MIIFQYGIVLDTGTDLNDDSPIIGYHNLVTSGVLTSTTAQTGYPVTNLANPSTHLLWKGNAASATEDVTVGALTEDSDYFGIARHNFGTGAIAVELFGSTNGGGAYSSLGTLSVVDNSPILFYFTKDTYTHFRLRLTVGSTKPQAAVIYCGESLRLQRRIYVGHTPITLGRRVTKVIGRSQSGNYLGRVVIGEDRVNSVSLQNLTPGWYREYFDPFVVAAKTQPFFFAWRPASYPLEVGYAWLSDDPTPSNQRANGMMQVELQLSGIV